MPSRWRRWIASIVASEIGRQSSGERPVDVAGDEPEVEVGGRPAVPAHRLSASAMVRWARSRRSAASEM